MTPWITIPLIVVVYGIFFPWIFLVTDEKHPERLAKLRKELGIK